MITKKVLNPTEPLPLIRPVLQPCPGKVSGFVQADPGLRPDKLMAATLQFPRYRRPSRLMGPCQGGTAASSVLSDIAPQPHPDLARNLVPGCLMTLSRKIHFSLDRRSFHAS